MWARRVKTCHDGPHYRDGQGKLVADGAISVSAEGAELSAGASVDAAEVMGAVAARRAAAATSFFFFATGFFARQPRIPNGPIRDRSES